MKSIKITFVLLLFTSAIACAQKSFKAGYLISNAGEKSTCYILDVDWKDNPTTIQYKTTRSDDVRYADINSIKAFEIDSQVKYVRETVQIDRASSRTQNLTTHRNPVFKEETLFLQVLIEGESTLYSYQDHNISRYFYASGTETPTQLVHKKFLTPAMKVGVNDLYKQQLQKELRCDQLSLSDFEKLSYTKKSLINLVQQYYTCKQQSFTIYERPHQKAVYELAVFGGVQSSNLELKKATSSLLDTKFEGSTSFTFGLEAAFALPFNNDKWLWYIRPSYHRYKNEKEITLIDTGSLNSTANVIADLNWLAIPIGIKHHLFLNDVSHVFIRGALVISTDLNSAVYAENRRSLVDLDLKFKPAFTLGLGYAYAKFGFAFDYTSPQEISQNDQWQTTLNTYTFSLSYRLL